MNNRSESFPDLYGQALADFYFRGKLPSPLWVHTSYGTREEMPLPWFFRSPDEFPELEQYALTLCHGEVLDIGAGVGPHALYLQQQGFSVTALEQSTFAAEVMTDRGITQVQNISYQNYSGAKVDTVLMLMNGIGLVGNLAGLSDFLNWAKYYLKPNGQLLFDSSDIAYLFSDQPLPTDYYYGEVQFQYEYQEQYSDWFSWLYIDASTLEKIAISLGWNVQTVYQDNADQYLFRLLPI
ncbi:MAG: methyltransferase domain-containing protein [Bacteroidota bacterium]